MEAKSNNDYAGSFLKNIQDSEQVESSVASLSLKLMTALAATGRSEVPKLMSESGLNLDEFMDTIKQLQEKGLVELEQSEGKETIGLSTAAEQIVRAMTFLPDDDAE